MAITWSRKPLNEYRLSTYNSSSILSLVKCKVWPLILTAAESSNACLNTAKSLLDQQSSRNYMLVPLLSSWINTGTMSPNTSSSTAEMKIVAGLSLWSPISFRISPSTSLPATSWRRASNSAPRRRDKRSWLL